MLKTVMAEMANVFELGTQFELEIETRVIILLITIVFFPL